MDEVIGKVSIIPAPIERELEDPSARYIEVVTQRVYVGRNQIPIFGDERQAAQLFCAASKRVAPGPGTHCPDWAVGAPAGTCHAAANPRK